MEACQKLKHRRLVQAKHPSRWPLDPEEHGTLLVGKEDNLAIMRAMYS